ncbi:MAG TPA: CvpA family protein [Stellaceae bacterium]|jgi:membrane protein required for colicin V production
MSLTVFDFVVIGVILISGIFAYARGFVREALSLAAWILAGMVAAYAYPYVVPLAEKVLPRGMVANGAAATVVFILALVILHMIAGGMVKRVRSSALSPVDRSLGLLFGLARGAIIVCLAYIALAWMLPPGKERPRWFADSRSLPYVEAGADALRGFIPLPAGAGARITAGFGNTAANSAASEAERAISAFAHPAGGAARAANAAPTYTQDEQHDLDRLIQQQQNSK